MEQAASVSETTPTRYRFGPLERRGLVAGWRGGQIGAIAIALVIGVGVLRASASAVGVVLALAVLAVGVGVATWPISGRTAEEWAPDALRHVAARVRRSRDRASPFVGVHLVEVNPSAQGSGRRGPGLGSVGVLHDRSRRTFTAVFRASDPGFVLLGEEDKARRVSAWSGVLASLARDGSAVHRVQWVERVVPSPRPPLAPGPDFATHGVRHDGARHDGARHDGARHDGARHDGARHDGAQYAAARASYDALVGAEARAPMHHEVLLALSVHAGRAARAVKAVGGGDAGACTVLLREVAALRRRLTDASIDVGAVLAPDELGAVLRGAYEGSAVPSRRSGPRAGPRSGRDAVASVPDGAEHRRSSQRTWPWPMGVTAEWSRLRADGTWHATYWVAEWPRTDTGPDFLGPLLLPSEVHRTMSVVMEPLGSIAAARKVERGRTADIADAELRRRGGFLATARRRREEEILVRREVELADGHAQYRFSGYVTVSAPDPDELEEACGRIEQAAGQAGLELRRCYGDQANAFLCTLPLGRGLS